MCLCVVFFLLPVVITVVSVILNRLTGFDFKLFCRKSVFISSLMNAYDLLLAVCDKQWP